MADCQVAGATGNLSRVALYGGDGRQLHRLDSRASFRIFSGTKYGRGSLAALDEAIQSGSIDLVVALVRFIGHSEYQGLKGICRARKTPMRAFCGSSIRRIVTELTWKRKLTKGGTYGGLAGGGSDVAGAGGVGGLDRVSGEDLEG